MARTLDVATAQYPIDTFTSFADFQAKAARWVQDAVSHGSQLLVLPEYGSMELASLLADSIRDDLHAQVRALQPMRDDVVATWRDLAQRYGVTLLAPSMPWQLDDERFVNRAWLFTPTGADFQDKQIMTRFERGPWGIGPGQDLKLFDTPAGRLGVLICYDSEFPLLARALVEAGAELLLVPSCTDTDAGYHRVRWCAQARAIEQQVAVVHSPTVGEALWSPAVDINIGRAAVYTPCDHGFPPNGVLALADDSTPGWQYARLDLDAIHELRNSGQVNNHDDWPLQHERLEHTVKRLSLR
ncbi:carbon-nitrogen hydrolase family protein [Halomonas sp. McH1-25]|uniref:carbon-nitrogen hydrolase family protein n=1 Tax=unclassified Halomonas TaxID=2609666 RepID=UPI001EF5C8AD|nr:MULTISPECIES: carbon-nitrogen hydrolase family protein [unclassified Halomonas]MCG7598202.1 carbon-nitrogen hydrolase family protein [Halomonas sp. McH1-25]MCP1341015.1 carbon-nitrogen hydrolase family protein [Halomonas sp. FL8]MCP1360922.1 carbon-nitrogen hydrolase family protein [Halomonas sp. BBD45]MCP1364745.1 carbon-nitrogen hydrolase family protein [Halomonas sp. BBD48]